MKSGLLLFAHGARDPQWALPFLQVVQQVKAKAHAIEVELAYLEFMTPDLPSAGARLVDLGCDRVDVVPLFLGAGGHVRRELPALVESLRQRFPNTIWRLHQAVGESPLVIEAMAHVALSSREAE